VHVPLEVAAVAALHVPALQLMHALSALPPLAVV
jgi:hypothetical protein